MEPGEASDAVCWKTENFRREVRQREKDKGGRAKKNEDSQKEQGKQSKKTALQQEEREAERAKLIRENEGGFSQL